MERWGHALRFLWNLCNEQRLLGMARPRGERRYYSAYDQHKDLTDLRRELSWLADVPYDVAAGLIGTLDGAWRRCFDGLASVPRWKRKDVDMVSLTQDNHRCWSLRSGSVVFPKLGPLRTVMHRPLVGVRRTCTLKRDGDQWFACITTEQAIADPAPSALPPVGIDRGVAAVIADSNGRVVPNPRHYESAMKRLARAQRAVSRRKKGSKNREKAKLRVMRLHRKVRRQREHALHVESHRIAKNHGVVVVEKLQVGNMLRASRGLARSISGAGWGLLREMLKYKLEEVGGSLVEVNPAYTSQTCSACGHVDPRSRISQSGFVCTACGVCDHADVNAAKNILSRRADGVAVCGGSAARGRPMKQKTKATPPSVRL